MKCEEIIMTDLYAKPIIDGKFWIVEQDGVKVGLLHKKKITSSC